MGSDSDAGTAGPSRETLRRATHKRREDRSRTAETGSGSVYAESARQGRAPYPLAATGSYIVSLWSISPPPAQPLRVPTMRRQAMRDRIEEAFANGQRNQKALRLLHNWCGHVQVRRPRRRHDRADDGLTDRPQNLSNVRMLQRVACPPSSCPRQFWIFMMTATVSTANFESLWGSPPSLSC